MYVPLLWSESVWHKALKGLPFETLVTIRSDIHITHC
jgi:hypothetical protein